MTPLITLKSITKKFDDTLIIDSLNLRINAGEFLVIVGPSGSGKSTLLRIMAGLDDDFRGEMKRGRDITENDISFVFQQFALMPWLTAFQNVALGLEQRGLTPQEIKKTVNAELKRMHLEKFAGRLPRELSGGQRQRVGIARALARHPKIIFMDEAFSELDSFTAQELRHEMLEIWRATGTTIVMVTHLIDEAVELADRIAVLSPRPARFEKILRNTLPRPREKRSAEFFALVDEIYHYIKP